MTNSAINISRLSTADSDFESQLERLLHREMLVAAEVNSTVSEILQAVRGNGDQAVIDFTNKFDGFKASTMQDLIVTKEQMISALEELPEEQKQALTHAAERIRRYHEKQKQSSWHYEEPDGSVYGQKVSPIQRVGVYVPGGKANYPSSMLMLAIPAQVAGVKEIVATVPTRYGEDGNLVFATAALAGVSSLFTIGGAQAIAALAYGTETIPKVDKIVGPGNRYVAEAKRQVFGVVGIDMIAGPSEVLVLCDGSTDPNWVAIDLCAQAEHDEDARAILICTESGYIDEVIKCIERLLPKLDRADIITTSLEKKGIFIKVNDMNEAIDIVNEIAPEHLELSVAEPQVLSGKIKHAGAIFMGRYTAEVLGDYCAGPSHVLPTSGTARFSSPLGVYDFQKRTSLIMCSEESASDLASTASTIANSEGFTAHALSAKLRINK